MRYLRLTAIAVSLALLSSAAHAQTIWEALERFGLTGAFATSCKDVPGPSNPWVDFYRDADGVVRRKLDNGSVTLMAAIDRAEFVAPATLKMRLRNDDPKWQASNGVVFDLILVRENAYVMTLQSTGSDGVE